jgi:NAD-dependent SIR2 family protein deacetylase
LAEPSEEKLPHAAVALAEADGLLIGAGAGMGVDSDLPDFRGKEGFWRADPHQPARAGGGRRGPGPAARRS